MSKLELVDLAGSERAGILNEDEKIAKESVLINKSLFTLRKVITTLTESQSNGKTIYVPYRDSKLTSVLRQSIGGNSYSLMISCLSPNDKFLEENLNTLNYSIKTAYIANQPIKNQDPNAKLIKRLKLQIVELTNELQNANEHIQGLTKLANTLPEHNPVDMAKTQEFSVENKEDELERNQGVTKTEEDIRISINTGAKRKKKTKIMDRLLQSVNMVKDVLQTNLKLRQQVLKMSKDIDRANLNYTQVQETNEELKERIQTLTNDTQEELDNNQTSTS